MRDCAARPLDETCLKNECRLGATTFAGPLQRGSFLLEGAAVRAVQTESAGSGGGCLLISVGFEGGGG